MNVLSAWRWLPESKQEHGKPGEGGATRQPLLLAFWDLLREPGSPVSSLIWVYAFGMMAFMAMNGVLALYLGAVYQVNVRNVGFFYTYVGAVSVVMRAILLGPTVRRFGEVGVMRMGAAALVAGLAGIPLVESVPDHSSVWRFREQLASRGLAARLLAEVNRHLRPR